MNREKCKYCGKTPAYKPAAAKKTYVCIDCLYDCKQYDRDFKRSLEKKAAFEYPYYLNVDTKRMKGE